MACQRILPVLHTGICRLPLKDLAACPPAPVAGVASATSGARLLPMSMSTPWKSTAVGVSVLPLISTRTVSGASVGIGRGVIDSSIFPPSASACTQAPSLRSQSPAAAPGCRRGASQTPPATRTTSAPASSAVPGVDAFIAVPDRSGRGDALADVRERLLDLVDQDQAEVACLERGERRVDGDEFAADLLHLARAPGVGEALAQ